jgi:hypothetical protein
MGNALHSMKQVRHNQLNSLPIEPRCLTEVLDRREYGAGWEIIPTTVHALASALMESIRAMHFSPLVTT